MVFRNKKSFFIQYVYEFCIIFLRVDGCTLLSVQEGFKVQYPSHPAKPIEKYTYFILFYKFILRS